MRRFAPFALGLLAGIAAVRLLRSRRRGAPQRDPVALDPRAEDLRRRLAESREEPAATPAPAAVAPDAEAPSGPSSFLERLEQASRPDAAEEEPADGVDAAPGEGPSPVDGTRREVHREARATLDEMRQAGL